MAWINDNVVAQDGSDVRITAFDRIESKEGTYVFDKDAQTLMAPDGTVEHGMPNVYEAREAVVYRHGGRMRRKAATVCAAV